MVPKQSANAKLTIEDSKITENSAPCIIGFYGGATILIKDESVVSGSTGNGPGAGLLLYGAKSLIVEKSKVEDNEVPSGSDGGAIYAQGTPVSLVGATIEKNEASDGGGLYLTEGASLKIQGKSKVTKNTATAHGGGVFKSSSAGAVADWIGTVEQPDDVTIVLARCTGPSPTRS